MTPWIALLLGVVEGLTEYLPVSSTGHLILVGHLLGLADGDPGTFSFEIVIQLGAILAVVAHYRTLLLQQGSALMSSDAAARRLFFALAVAFVPTAAAGLLLRKTIKNHLFGPLPVTLALVVGGIAMIVIERQLRARRPSGGGKAVGGDSGLESITPARALAIGLGQCASLWPGASRAMCTIVAGQLAGLSTATAAEFSFLLALPTLGAATLYEASKARFELASHVGWANVAIGLTVSFAVAWGVIASFLKYLRTHGLEPFGWYRVAVGVVVLLALR